MWHHRYARVTCGEIGSETEIGLGAQEGFSGLYLRTLSCDVSRTKRPGRLKEIVKRRRGKEKGVVRKRQPVLKVRVM